MISGCGAERNMSKGDKYMALGEYYDAAREYKTAYQRTQPKDRELRGQRAAKMAACYNRINEHQRAIAAYRNVIRYNQDDASTHYYLAENLMKNGNYREAEKEYQAVLAAPLQTTQTEVETQPVEPSAQDKASVKKKAKKTKVKNAKKTPTVSVRKERQGIKKKKKKEHEAKEQSKSEASPQLPTPNSSLLTSNSSQALRKAARRGLTAARQAAEQKAKGSRYTVKKMQQFNSRRSDYSPMLFGDQYDQLYWTSTRNEAQGDELSGITGTKPADIFGRYLMRRGTHGTWDVLYFPTIIT